MWSMKYSAHSGVFRLQLFLCHDGWLTWNVNVYFIVYFYINKHKSEMPHSCGKQEKKTNSSKPYLFTNIEHWMNENVDCQCHATILLSVAPLPNNDNALIASAPIKSSTNTMHRMRSSCIWIGKNYPISKIHANPPAISIRVKRKNFSLRQILTVNGSKENLITEKRTHFKLFHNSQNTLVKTTIQQH